MNIRAGIDLGGTKIQVAAFDCNDQQIYQKRIPTPQGDYHATLKAIHQLILSLEKELGSTASVGIGTPGAISAQSHLLQNANSTCLNGKPLLHDLEAQLQRPVRLSNDANCFALSEAVDGAAKDANNVFGVIIGTGTGAGIVIDKKILQGINHIGGEWGHNPLPWPQESELTSTDCYCGKKGCIETFLSGPGMQLSYFKATNLKRSCEEIVNKAEEGDIESEACLQRYEDRMARSLAHIINILDPEVIVLGGGLSKIKRLYTNVPKRLPDYVFSRQAILTKIIPAKFGDASGVRGAARLWPLT